MQIVEVPFDTTCEHLLALGLEGLVISNGPGDPAELERVVHTLRQTIARGTLPTFGICLGHQLLAQALGAKTYKLKYGHRGGNQPVLDCRTGDVIITAQNHGYAVDSESLPADVEQTMINLNDGTNEGLRHTTMPISRCSFTPKRRLVQPMRATFLQTSSTCFASEDRRKNERTCNSQRARCRLWPNHYRSSCRVRLCRRPSVPLVREEALRVVFVNSNPATIMTDPEMADAVYLEPLVPAYVEAIIERERPDAMLATLGGQTGLNLAVALAERGTLERYGVRLLGTPLRTIRLAEDRKLFKEAMGQIGEPVPARRSSRMLRRRSRSLEKPAIRSSCGRRTRLAARAAAQYTMRPNCDTRSRPDWPPASSIRCFSRSSLLGWKEIEYEVLRDCDDNCIAICNMENVDPVGVHTGDSIVVAPSQTLSDRDYQRLRTAALNIIRHLRVEGGCNIQFALDPHSDAYQVIEVNPRVSRSSALASKATGYPIAKVATKIALGYKLPELSNPVTGVTKAAFEPMLDYCVVKIPRWPFDKFPLADTRLGTQMKSTGEVMAIGRTFGAALLKAVRGLDIGRDTLTGAPFLHWSDDELADVARTPTHDRLFVIAECLRRGRPVEELASLTSIDPFWLWELRELVEVETRLAATPSADLINEAKAAGFAESTIARLTGRKLETVRRALTPASATAYKMVDTAAAEFPAQSPYYYATVGEEDELRRPRCASVVVVGSGPIRIGQGIEFDYSCVHAAWALHDAGVASVMINNNPETVSTDFDVSDVLIFEPPCADEVEHAVRVTSAMGTLLIFGGQTPINLARELGARGVSSWEPSQGALDLAEDRRKFDALLQRLGVARPSRTDGALLSQGARDCALDRVSRPRAPLVRPWWPGHGDRVQRGAACGIRRKRAADSSRGTAACRQIYRRNGS